ncbi:uncharacterized protein LY79DRAFT_543336 [Colletotrichum navitas]|uniref:Uncharacterized protein n=1 Tax=Colletotrichum navitas TaxID=681940 RepID=A0AAD8Q710_9PEZI|nr:uncharacterized protein LY79DRAFT_543336 [Colletotrichum navitas]KAK1596977.1 hypothetical protein LY79DRAFT_543336 [Colletotrichum navitas]
MVLYARVASGRGGYEGGLDFPERTSLTSVSPGLPTRRRDSFNSPQYKPDTSLIGLPPNV